MFHESQGWRLFAIRDINVSISFGYVFIMAWIIFSRLSRDQGGLAFGIALAAVVTVSILIHELGHALVSKYYKLRPSILLHGFGGLCLHDEADTDARDALIVLAGPLLQIFVGVLSLLIQRQMPLPGQLETIWFFFGLFSVAWGLINMLLPAWPLDGGKLLHLILRRFLDADRARIATLWTSIIVVVPIGIYAVSIGRFFAVIISVLIVMECWGLLQSGSPLVSRGGARRKVTAADSQAQELLQRAEAAFAQRDFDMAGRLCHQARGLRLPMSDAQAARVWELLTLSALHSGDLDEAREFIKYAPDTPDIHAAREQLAQHAQRA
jgi:Zn-dependent protease